MKKIEVDEQLYNYIAGQTQHIGESASDILRRLLLNDNTPATDPVSAIKSETVNLELKGKAMVNESAPKVVIEERAILEPQAKKNPTQQTEASIKKVRKPMPRHTESSQLVIPDLALGPLLACSEFNNLALSISRFLMILAVLHKDKPKKFALACEIKGKKRSYFSKDKQQLAEAGRTTKPRAIPNSPYWVITNVNSGRKRLILSQLMKSMAYDTALIDAACLSLTPID